MSIEISHVTKRFGNFVALDDIALDIPTGELVALLGPSGCGKTTLLRIIAGMESADAGHVKFAGEDATHLHVRERQVGFVFQHYALFRHMTVFENVAFGLRVKPRDVRPGEAEIRRRVFDLLKLVQLDWLADRYPSQLSEAAAALLIMIILLCIEKFFRNNTRHRKHGAILFPVFILLFGLYRFIFDSLRELLPGHAFFSGHILSVAAIALGCSWLFHTYKRPL